MKVQFTDEAKRARELGDYLSAQTNMERVSIIKPLVDIDSYDPLEIAFQELKEEKIAFEVKKKEEK